MCGKRFLGPNMTNLTRIFTKQELKTQGSDEPNASMEQDDFFEEDLLKPKARYSKP